MIDPFAKINERIREKRRAQGRRGDEFDALIRAASQELGRATEAALGVFVDVGERVGLRFLEEATKVGGRTGPLRFAPQAVRAARTASSRLPGASGRVLSTSSEVILRTGFTILRELRRRLENTRHRVQPSGGRRPPPTPGGGGPSGERRPPRTPRGEGPSAERRPPRTPAGERPPERPPTRGPSETPRARPARLAPQRKERP